MEGLIIKIINNFLYVKTKENKVYECKSKGIFRYKKIKPLVGDYVHFNIIEDNKGIIDNVLERKNILIRPAIVNIDQVIIITASKKPDFSSMLLNKYLFIIEYLQIKPILVFTKKDLLNLKNVKDKQLYEKIKWYQKMNYKYFLINNKSHNKEDEKDIFTLKQNLKNKISVFAGQTGAGKSTTINNLLGYERQKTAEISKALGRGKHTTRISEIINFEDSNIIDSPGFSAFEIKDVNLDLFSKSISAFNNEWKNCKFTNCIHLNEPNCAVKKLYENKKIPTFFYEDYKKIVDKIKKDL